MDIKGQFRLPEPLVYVAFYEKPYFSGIKAKKRPENCAAIYYAGKSLGTRVRQHVRTRYARTGGRKQKMKKVLIALILLVVVAVGAVFLLPGLIDWNDHRARLAEELRALSGREVSIEGDVSLQLLPVTAFSVGGVTVANLPDGSNEPFATLENLTVRLRPLALLQGRVEVERIELRRPALLLERLPDGQVNWRFQAGTAATGTGSGGGGGSPGADQRGLVQEVALERIQIVDGRVTYRDLEAGTEESLESINARLSAPSLQGPFELEGALSYRERALAVALKTGQLGSERLPVSLDLGLPEAGGEASFRGHLENALGAEPGLSGLVTLEAGRLSRVTRLLGGPGAEIGLLDQAFELEGRLEARPEALRLVSERLLLGGQSADLTLGARLDGPQPGLSMDITLPRLDLDALLGQLAEAGGNPPASVGAGQAGGESAARRDAGFVLPDSFSADVTLSVGALLYRGQVVRELGLDARLAEGEVAVTRAVALLPGGSDAALTGRVWSEAGEPRFDTRVEGASDNLRALLDWLGLDLDSVPRDRLRQASVTAAVSGGVETVNIGELDLRVDLSRLTGGVAVVMGAKPGLGIGLSLDRIDLDAYLPDGQTSDGATGDGATGDGATGAGATGAGADASGQPGDGSGATGLAPLLDAVNANMDLRVENLSYAGVTAEELYLDASLADGALDLRRLVVGNLADSYLEFSGALDAKDGAPSADLAVQVTAQDPAALARAFGQDLPILERVGPGVLAGDIKGTPGRLDLDLQLSALSGTLELVGSVNPLTRPLAFDLETTARHGQFGGLGRALGLPGFERATPGPLELKGRVAGDIESLEMDLEATLGEGRYGAVGRLQPGADPLSFELALDLTHPQARSLWRSFGGPAGTPLGALAITGTLGGDARRMVFEELDAGLGDTRVTGSLAYDASGARPRIDGDLASPALDLAALAALGAGGQAPAQGEGTGQGTNQGGASQAGQGPRWSREPFELSALQDLDGQLSLEVGRLSAPKIVMTEVVLQAALDAGLLTVESFEGLFVGGKVSGEGTLDARTRPTFNVSFDAARLDSKPLLREFADFDRVSGPVSLSGTLAGAGRSEAEMVESLSGLGKIEGRLTFEPREEEKLGNLALTILGQKVGEIAGVANSATSLFNAFADRPGDLSGSYRVDAGVLTSNDLRLENDRARVEDRLTLNLPDWTLRTRAELYRKQDAADAPPYLTLDAEGPIDEPNLRVAGRAFATTGGASGGAAGGQQAPSGSGNPLVDQIQRALPGLVQPQPQPQPQPEAQTAPEPQTAPAASQPEPAPEPTPEPTPEPETQPEEAAPAPEPEASGREVIVVPEPKPAPPPEPEPAPREQEPDPDALIKGILKKLTQ